MREAYKLTVKVGIEEVVLSLRLTLGGQLNLKKKYNKKDIMEVFYEAMDYPEVMADVFTESLSFAGNANSITDGISLYDVLVDNGYKGAADFVPLLTSIGNTSGFITDKLKAVIDKMATRENEVDVDETLAEVDKFLSGDEEAKNA